MASDSYYTISQPTEGLYKEKGSKFFAYAYPVKSIEEIELYLEELRALHHKARHHCYAYELGITGDIFRANDDGEPSGTAGKPILGQLHSHEVSDVLVVVVRYFGGTKLGASGLIAAYRESAKEALSIAERKEVILGNPYELLFDYEHMGHVMNCIKSLDLEISSKEFTDSCSVVVSIRRSMQDELITKLKALILEVSIEQIEDDTKIPFCKINKLEQP